MLDFHIDKDKCIRCGECAADCASGIIKLNDYPAILPEDESKCIECQHCLAVCKPGALSIFGKNPEASLPLKGMLPDPLKMETLIMGRRSIRRYHKEGIDPALIHHLLNVVSHAPTAVNNRSTTLTVIDNPAVMDIFREKATTAALAALHEDRIPAPLKRMADYLKGCESGRDIIFRGAPHLLVASAPETALAPEPDCFIAMSYFDLLASSHGIGTVWDGIAKTTLTMIIPEVCAELGIPSDHRIIYMMAFGKPAVKYHRTVQRPGGSIRSVTL